MELLLNLAWIAVALAAFAMLPRSRGMSLQRAKVPYSKAFLALACGVVLLFPVVSASDDLHPTQVVLEDATKRLQLAVAPLQHIQAGSFTAMLPALLALALLFAFSGSQFLWPVSRKARVVLRERTPRDGRSPPSL